MSPSTRSPRAADPPACLNRFIGRERELAEAAGLLGASRLVTLTGAGGSGKSRLAAALAGQLAGRYRDGVVWAELSPLADPALLPLHLATLLGLPEQPGRGPEEMVLDTLAGREVLLVLDSCEHLVDAVASLAATLLRQCPDLHVLATSREALGIPGERAWLVPPLGLPDERDPDPGRSEAVELFVDRAREALPGFVLRPESATAVTTICRRLDGIPLAIELAAARIRVMPPEQIAERLDDAFRLLTAGSRTALPRHKTLRKAIDWSYDLLPPREQLLLQRLGVFGGSFTLEAAETVCTDEALPASEVLDALAALVDKSLVVLESREDVARYVLGDTMRQYAAGLLQDTGALDRWRERLARWALDLAEEAAPHIFGGASDEGWLRRLDAESGSLRAAMGWAEEDEDRVEVALRFGVALHWYWFARSRFREGRQRLERALAQAQSVPAGIVARACIAHGHVRLWQGEAPDVAAFRRAVELLSLEETQQVRAYALASLGAGLAMTGEFDEAITVLEDASRVVDTLPEQVLSCFARYWLGVALLGRQRHDEAQHVLEAALEIGWRIGSKPSVAHPLTILARVRWAKGDLDYALAAFRESAALHAEVRDAWGMVQAVEGVARIRLSRGDHRRGVALLAGAEAFRQRLGMPMPALELRAVHAALDDAAAALGPDAAAAAVARGQQMEEAELLQLALEAEINDPRIAITAELPVPRPAASPVPRLRVISLGGLEVHRDGTAIGTNAWGSARARDLLLLLLLRRQGLTKEEVGLVFWPEASTAQVRNSFHVTLHRLRKALTQPDWIVTEGERYRLRPGLQVEHDAEAFEQAILVAIRSAERGAPGARADLAAALAAYRGPFLAGTQAGDWAVEMRDRLQMLATRGLLALGRLQAAEGEHGGAAGTYQRLLGLDDLNEEGCRGLMLALARQGDRAQAMRSFVRLSDRLRQELEAEPDPETITLYEQIRRGETP